MAHENSQIVPADLALWIADVIQIQALASQTPVSDEMAKVIYDSATRLLDVLEGRLTPDVQARMAEVAKEMALAVAA